MREQPCIGANFVAFHPATQLYLAHRFLPGVPRRVVFSSSDLSRAQGLPQSASFSDYRLPKALKIAAEALFCVLFPSDCRLCRTPLTNVSRLPVCSTCLENMIPLAGTLCNICGEKLLGRHFERDSGPLCALCERAAPPFRRAFSYGAYQGPLRDLVHIFKYQQVNSAAGLLGDFLNHAVSQSRLPDRLLAVPVPLARNKRHSRGFNQAEEIARAFVRSRRAAASIQLDTATLVRTRETASQTGLTRHQRRANVRGAFAVTNRERIAGRDILVIDDVMTTGTTVSECARVLLRAGAKQVFVATVARATREAESGLARAAAADLGGTPGHA